MILAPKPEELSAYYQSYLKYIPVGADLLTLLKEQAETTQQFLSSIPAAKETYAYAEGKWMLKEIIGHLCDTERILSYRALRFSRNDATPLPGFDENTYTPNANYNTRSLQNIAQEFAAIRQSTIALFENMDAPMFERKGMASNNPVSVRALLFFIICHEKHHLTVIRERYLK